GAALGCAASGEKAEPGHIARYHCLTSTSKNGFLTGADTIRSLDDEFRCFNPNGLKYRSYYYDWDRGHRYILNLRDGEVYTRHYQSLGMAPEFFVPNDNGKDLEAANERYHVRGNGVWRFKPALTATAWPASVHSFSNVTALGDGGVAPTDTSQSGEIIFKIDGANVITALKIHARLLLRTASDVARIAVSTVNGLVCKEIWRSDQVGEQTFDRQLVKE